MRHLHEIKDAIIQMVYYKIECFDDIDAEELGKAIDMIKDISETMYYCTIVEAMNKEKKESE